MLSIANQALYRVGADPIDSFGDDSTESKLISVVYSPIKKALLRAYDWNCATRRVALTEHNAAPVNEYDTQFVLPDKCLRVLDVFIDDLRPEAASIGHKAYSIEGNKLLTNYTQASIVYIHDISEAQLDSHVEEALVAKIAFEISYTINASNTQQSQLGAIYEAKLQEARTTDATENPHVVIRTDGLTKVRY